MPEIETERLRLRMFVPEEDAGAMYDSVWSDPRVMRYIMPDGWPHPREESAALLRRLLARFREHGFGQWAVVPKDLGRVVGYCGLKHLDNTLEVEVLYGLAQEFWGRGYTTEAARAALRYGFEEVHLGHIVSVAMPENVGSWRVMEKLGMRREGIARYYNYDLLRYSIEREDFDPGPGRYVLSRDESSRQ